MEDRTSCVTGIVRHVLFRNILRQVSLLFKLRKLVGLPAPLQILGIDREIAEYLYAVVENKIVRTMGGAI